MSKFLNNPYERRRKPFFHHSTGTRARKYPIIPDTGWTVRYRDPITGQYAKFQPGLKLKAEHYIFKQSVEDTDAPKGASKKKASTGWVPARDTLLRKARGMAKQFMTDNNSEVPYDEWELLEKGPIAYKWLHQDFKYLNDHQTLDGGNYCVFYILIAVYGEDKVSFMIIRKTVMLDGQWPVERMVAEQHIFDDLGRDYVMRQGHLWTSEAMSPQIVMVKYIGFLGFTLFPFVPLSQKRSDRRRKRNRDRNRRR